MTFTALTGYDTPSIEHTQGTIQLRGLSGTAHFVITLTAPFLWYWTRGHGVVFTDRFQLSFDADPTPSYAFRLERGTGTNFFLIPSSLPGGEVEIDCGKCAKLGYEPSDPVTRTLTATPGSQLIDATVPDTWVWN